LIGDNATDLSELAKSEPVASLLNAAQARLHADFEKHGVVDTPRRESLQRIRAMSAR
jgi:hypothetical protein